MKIDLSSEATEALMKIAKQLKTINPFIDRTKSQVASGIILAAVDCLDDREMEALADRLVSAEGKRKALLKRLGAVSQKAGVDAFRSIEAAIKKLEQSIEKSDPESNSGAAST